ncbi:MAG: Glycosyl transferase, group 1 family [uncultured bacterium]|nr:MAG: Glycosyl transferase, group 1 family [uncultured bacterium]
MKILFISRAYPPTVGGIENQNYELGKWLSEISETKVLANKKGKRFLPFFLPYASAMTILTMHKYDALLLGDGVLGVTGWISKFFYPQKPVICVVHGLDLTFPSRFYQKVWVNFFLKRIDKFIAVGNETINVGEEKKLGREKFMFIPNGVDTEKHLCESTRAELEKVLGVPVSDKKIMLTAGRLAKRKGVAWFVKNVMPKLSSDFTYVVSGDGPDKENILNAIKEEQLSERVLMLGYVTDEVRNTLLNTADLFLQPNIKIPGDMEGFGISVIEAGACRLPVLASNMEGLKDAIKDGKNGFLVESENADAYVQKINELFAKGSPREIYGQTVRDFVVENYQWEKIAKQYSEEIRKTIAELKN